MTSSNIAFTQGRTGDHASSSLYCDGSRDATIANVHQMRQSAAQKTTSSRKQFDRFMCRDMHGSKFLLCSYISNSIDRAAFGAFVTRSSWTSSDIIKNWTVCMIDVTSRQCFDYFFLTTQKKKKYNIPSLFRLWIKVLVKSPVSRISCIQYYQPKRNINF